MSNEILIKSWDPSFQPAFYELNRAWIERDYPLEPVDIAVLSDPDTHILSAGGAILSAVSGNTVVGVVALRTKVPGVFELTKMAVDPPWQGKGIGQQLILAALDHARRLSGSKVILYSNTHNNAPAINLYRKLGFKDIPLEPGVYKRANIKMEISLHP
jgi:ribosomal protein S18 acetylase RimI-like enzyme